MVRKISTCYKVKRHEANQTEPRRVSFHFLSGHTIVVQAGNVPMWEGEWVEAEEVNALIQPHERWLNGGKRGITNRNRNNGALDQGDRCNGREGDGPTLL
jgi:hypothetical protein